MTDNTPSLEAAAEQLNALTRAAQRIVFFGGAGVSTESGIPDFRSRDGLYARPAGAPAERPFVVPPETILSRSYFERHPEEFFRFYRAHQLNLTAQPNAAHLKLAELERAGQLTAIVTQNIDGLHQAAGSRVVLELHGSIWRNHCGRCGRPYDVHVIAESTGLPRCVAPAAGASAGATCGGLIEPDVVLYEDPLDYSVIAAAIEAIAAADLLIVGGTSLAVYPAAGLIDHFHGDHLVIVNRDALVTGRPGDLVITWPIAQVFALLEV